MNDWNDYSCGVKVIFMEALKRLELCRTDERLWLSIATKRRLADDRSLLEYVGMMKLVG